MKTKLEIIEETVAFYSEDTSRRAYKEGRCFYRDEKGCNCAVGRLINTEHPKVEEVFKSTAYSFVLFCNYGFDILKEEYQITDDEFWFDLQMLHDDNSHWDKKGLTERGLTFANKLKEKYK